MEQRRTLDPDDYTVAWICALSTELAASKAMLDEQHAPAVGLPRANDHNTYTLGSIANHNIVMTCLPIGTPGTVSAALVVHQMQLTFPSIEYGLMVGVGGGAPGYLAEIRLGDVVVSCPTKRFNGVIPYDYGKMTAGGNLQYNRVLNKPPEVLLAAMADIKATDGLRENQMITKMINEAKRKFPAIALQITSPGPASDLLFQSAYEHTGDDGDDCVNCDRGKLTVRSPRASEHPIIHYGLIASGNQVMKHATTRDKFAQEQGVLCFEMEAAGVMDQMPCLVIRGISDYADSHKSKLWQGYASAVAAGYAKGLLSVIPARPRKVVSRVTGPLPRPSYWHLPLARNALFTGRQRELDVLANAMENNHHLATFALTGLGGIGKTQIALEFAYRTREAHPSCSIFWISAGNKESMEQSYVRCCTALGIAETEPSRAGKEVLRRLETDHLIPWLLIVDNIDDMNFWTAHKEWFPRTGKGMVVYTTRNRKVAVKMASPNVHEIPCFSMGDAKSLLGHHLIDQGLLQDHESCRGLLRKLVYLPLAIRQAAAYINSNGITIADYISLLDEEEPELIEVLNEDFEDNVRPATGTNAVASTWIVSFSEIQNLDSLAAEYLALMSCLDPHKIPSSILPSKQSRKKVTDAIGTLAAYAFITREPSTSTTSNPRLLNLHPLVHLAIRNWLRENKSLGIWSSKAMERLDAIFPEHDSHHGKDQEFGSWRCYLPHVKHVVTTVDDISISGVDLLEKYGLCLHTDGRYRDAEDPLCKVVQAMTNAFGHSDPRTINSMNNLALNYSAQHHLGEAKDLQDRALDHSETALGSTHPHTMNGKSTLATIYQKQGRWDQAQALGFQVSEYRKSKLGLDDPLTLTSLENLGCTYLEQGRWKEAETLISQVLQTRTRLWGERDADTMRSMNNLALIHVNQEEWDKAVDLYTRVLDIAKEVLGNDHPDTISYAANLSYTQLGHGMLIEAEELSSHTLEQSSRVLGPVHPTTLIIMANVATVRKELGREDDAFTLLESCIKVSWEVLGPDHPFNETYGDMLLEWDMARDGFDSCAVEVGENT